jgi:hypothetical protein
MKSRSPKPRRALRVTAWEAQTGEPEDELIARWHFALLAGQNGAILQNEKARSLREGIMVAVQSYAVNSPGMPRESAWA